MPKFNVPVTLIEYGRLVLVEAATKAEAAAKARSGDWIQSGDPASYKVTVVGKIHAEN